MAKKEIIIVKGLSIATLKINKEDYISLTDIARQKNAEEPKDVVKNWMRSRTTIEFLGLWEQLNNPDFKGVEFDSFLFEAGSNSFTMSPTKWIESTNAKGLVSKVGNTGGTFAQKDIAFEFASWVSSGFKLYLIKEFQRLKEEENNRLKLECLSGTGRKSATQHLLMAMGLDEIALFSSNKYSVGKFNYKMKINFFSERISTLDLEFRAMI